MNANTVAESLDSQGRAAIPWLRLASFVAICLLSVPGVGQDITAEHFEAELGRVAIVPGVSPTPLPTPTPTVQPTVTPLPYAPPLLDIDSDDGTPLFDMLVGASVLAFYRNFLTDSQRQQVEFAEKGSWMMGGHFASILNLDSGEGRTRTSSTSVAYDVVRQTIGGINQAVGIEGSATLSGRKWAGVVVTGRSSIGAIAYPEDPESVSDSMKEDTAETYPAGTSAWRDNPQDGWLWRLYSTVLVGAESNGFPDQALDLGKLDGQGHFLGPVDARRYNIHESDLFAVSPAVIKKQRTFTSVAYLDIGQGTFSGGGRVDTAFGQRSAVVSDIEDSWIHVNETHGFATEGMIAITRSNVPSIPGNSACVSDDTIGTDIDENARWGGRIDDYVALEIEAVDHRPGEIEVNASIGVLIDDMDYDRAGGAPAGVADATDPSYLPRGMNSQDQVAAIVSKGDCLLAQTHGIVHVRDALHLSPYPGTPEVDLTGTNFMEYGGMLVFNDVTNTIQISHVAKGLDGPSISWHSLKYDHIDSPSSWVPEGRFDDGYRTGNPPTEELSALITPDPEVSDRRFRTPRLKILDATDLSDVRVSLMGFAVVYSSGSYSIPSLAIRRCGFGLEEIGEREPLSDLHGPSYGENDPRLISVDPEYSGPLTDTHLRDVVVSLDISSVVNLTSDDGQGPIDGQIIQIFARQFFVDEDDEVARSGWIGDSFRYAVPTPTPTPTPTPSPTPTPYPTPTPHIPQ